MHIMGVNVWAVLVGALATMVVGFLWYSPMLFANPWMKLMGYDPNDKAKVAEMQKSAGAMYSLSLVASVLSAAVLAKIIGVTVVSSPLSAALLGMEIGFAVWLGFVTTVQLTGALFTKQPAKLYAINTGYQLVCYLAMGAILGGWR